MVEIAGKVNKTFDSSIGNAQKKLGGFGNALKKVGIAVSAASVAMAGMNFLKDGVEQAIAFESTMADVAKVVDGLRDENGRLTESYYQMSDAILEMSTRIPMTVDEIGQITAAAGQAGIAKEDLMQFTETAAKMGIAFDTTADQAGEWMAAWRTSFGMSQDEVVALADQINYLGNTTSENTLKLSGVITRIGALGKTAGLSGAEIAAMAASMTGVTEEISATGVKNLMLTMTAGSAATKSQQEALDRLGISAVQLAERMQVDAKGAILDLLGAIRLLPEAEQSAMLTQYFGKESVAAIAPLLSNLGYLEEQFRKVEDASLYAGSMEAEYAARSDTTANKMQLAQQSIDKLKIELGEKLLPVVGDAAEALSGGIEKLSAFIEENKEAIPFIAAFVGSLGTMIAAQKAFNLVSANGAMLAAGFGQAVGFLTSPMGIAMVAIAALIAAGVLLYKNWDTVKAKAQELWTKVKEVFGGIKDAIIEAFESAKQKVAGFFGWLDGKISSVPILGSLYDAGKGAVKSAGSFLMKNPAPYNPVPAMASGGIVTAPTLSLIGEGNEAEAVLPLSKLEQMLSRVSVPMIQQTVYAADHAEKTDSALQLPEFKKIISDIPSLSVLQGNLSPDKAGKMKTSLPLSKLEQILEGISLGNGGKIVFAPKIEIKGKADKEEVTTAVRMSFEEFKRLMERYEKDRQRAAF